MNERGILWSFLAILCRKGKEIKRRMKKKQVVSGLLATVMIANIALVDMGPVQAAENLNLAKGCNVTASSYEVSDQIDTSPAKAVDGDMATPLGELHRTRQIMNGLKLIWTVRRQYARLILILREQMKHRIF